MEPWAISARFEMRFLKSGRPVSYESLGTDAVKGEECSLEDTSDEFFSPSSLASGVLRPSRLPSPKVFFSRASSIGDRSTSESVIWIVTVRFTWLESRRA